MSDTSSACDKIAQLSWPPSESLEDLQVTSKSRFKDEIWNFENPTPGAHGSVSKINWAMQLNDESRLTDAFHSERLRWVKMLVLSRLLSPADGQFPAPGSMGMIQLATKWLISWMVEQGYYYPSELTPLVVQDYIDDLPRFILAQQDDEKIALGTATRALQLLQLLWIQREPLKKLGIQGLSQDPYFFGGIIAIAEAIATKPRGGWIKPLPDEVAIPLLNKAFWFVGRPADDIVKLVKLIAPSLSGETKAARYERIHKIVSAFKFSLSEDGEMPWHAPLGEPSAEDGSINPLARITELFSAVRDACSITIQGTSGMRISELMGIEAGINKVNGLPIGVRLEDSMTGQYEWFVIRTAISKNESSGTRDVDWVLGMRPKGSEEMPPAVRAILVLNHLLAPWRDENVTNRLLLAAVPGAYLPRTTTPLNAMSSLGCGLLMKRFISNWVDLSALPDESFHKVEGNDLVKWRESKGSVFTTHMLRKSWASFTLAVDPRLLPAIQMQFHHLSLAMTEGGYIGNNPMLVDSLRSVSLQKRNLMLFELVTGKASLAGRMGEYLENATAGLREELSLLQGTSRWKKVAEWADANEIQMYFSAHATCCPVKTSEMRCNDAAKTPMWVRNEPNYEFREPSLCAGCACAVMDRSHEEFWKERYISSTTTFRKAQIPGISRQFRVIEDRALQALKVLRKFGGER